MKLECIATTKHLLCYCSGHYGCLCDIHFTFPRCVTPFYSVSPVLRTTAWRLPGHNGEFRVSKTKHSCSWWGVTFSTFWVWGRKCFALVAAIRHLATIGKLAWQKGNIWCRVEPGELQRSGAGPSMNNAWCLHPTDFSVTGASEFPLLFKPVWI